MDRLYKDDGTYAGTHALDLDQEIMDLLEPYFKKYHNRDLVALITSSVTTLSAVAQLTRQAEKFRDRTKNGEPKL